MDWASIGSRDAVLAICANWRIDFEQAEAHLLARQLQGAEDEHGAGGAGEEEGGEEDEEAEDDGVIPMPGQELITLGAALVGSGEEGFGDGAAAEAMFGTYLSAMLRLPDERVLVADSGNRRIRVLSADLQQVSTVAGVGGLGHRDGSAAQAQFFNGP
jgi:hypothetical protein